MGGKVGLLCTDTSNMSQKVLHLVREPLNFCIVSSSSLILDGCDKLTVEVVRVGTDVRGSVVPEVAVGLTRLSDMTAETVGGSRVMRAAPLTLVAGNKSPLQRMPSASIIAGLIRSCTTSAHPISGSSSSSGTSSTISSSSFLIVSHFASSADFCDSRSLSRHSSWHNPFSWTMTFVTAAQCAALTFFFRFSSTSDISIVWSTVKCQTQSIRFTNIGLFLASSKIRFEGPCDLFSSWLSYQV